MPTVSRAITAAIENCCMCYNSFYTDQIWLGTLMNTDMLYNSSYRFLNITIPKSATINSAFFSLYDASMGNPATNNIVYGNAIDNAVAPLDWAELVALVKTNASVVWDVPVTIGGLWLSPNDLKAIIQEIVNRANWVSGNALQIIIYDGVTADFVRDRLTGYSDDPTKAPTLVIDYSAGGGPSNKRTLLGVGK